MKNQVVAGVAVGLVVWSVVAAAGVAAQTPTPIPGADVGRAEDQIVLSGSVTVPRGRSVGEIVVFHGRAWVAGVVAGDVVVLNGPIVVSGQVSGSVVALNGPIRLGPTASVGRDVLGGQAVRLEPGALVAGQVRDRVAFTPRGALAVLGRLLGPVALAVSLLLTLLLLLAIAPRALDGAATAGATSPFASMAWGFAISVAVPLFAAVAAITIVGLPFGLAVGLAAGWLWMLGLAFGCFAIGRAITGRAHGRARPLFAGWGLVAAAGLVPFLNAAVWVLVSAFGLGAALVAAWRARSAAPRGGRHRASS
ncbi:MAG TPA: hypothetical protein VNC60_07700, partial [Actinomycetota bacterium]|nr:hypothetical protein [Actinomycetota bacterium]